MIRHCVMLRLHAEADVKAVADVCAGLAGLVDRLDGCSNFGAGPNRDYEGKTPGFTYGLTFDARDPAALAAYASHPEHLAYGAQLVALSQDGANGIRVYDLEISA